MQSVHRLQIFREWPAPKAPGDRLLDHLRLIHVIEGGGHGLARGVAIDAHRLNLPHHARPTMLPSRRGSCSSSVKSRFCWR